MRTNKTLLLHVFPVSCACTRREDLHGRYDKTANSPQPVLKSHQKHITRSRASLATSLPHTIYTRRAKREDTAYAFITCSPRASAIASTRRQPASQCQQHSQHSSPLLAVPSSFASLRAVMKTRQGHPATSPRISRANGFVHIQLELYSHPHTHTHVIRYA